MVTIKLTETLNEVKREKIKPIGWMGKNVIEKNKINSFPLFVLLM